MMTKEAVASILNELLEVDIKTAESVGGAVTLNLAFCRNLAALAKDYLKLAEKCERLKEEKDRLQTALDSRDAHDYEALSLKLYNGEMKDPRGVKFTDQFNSDLAFYLKNRKKKGQK